MRRYYAWVAGFCTLAGITLYADASDFVDPLLQPALISEKVSQSRLSAVAAGGKNLVVVGPMGHVLVSNDQGKSWTQSAVPLSSDLVAVRFVGEQKVWAVGHDGVILHSEDAGRTWVRQLDGNQVLETVQAQLARIKDATDEDTVRRRDDLEHFIADGAAKPFFDIAFLNEQEGFAVGPFNLAFHTVDGGNHWLPVSDLTDNPESSHLYALTVVSSRLWMVGERGLVRYWDSSAGRFRAVSTPYEGSYFGVVGGRGILLAFGMMGQAVRSTDDGRTWSLVKTDAQSAITGGTQLQDGRIVLVTPAGELLVSHNQGASFSAQPATRPMPYFSVVQAGPDSVVLAGALGVRVEPLL